MAETGLIKDWLKRQETTLSGKPIFRLVWSDAQTEKRHGTFNDFYGDLFIRQVTETRETLKYNYIGERWVLEKWVPPEAMVSNKELVDISQGSYEPFFVFEDSKRNYLAPTLKSVQFIVELARQQVRMTPQEKKKLAEQAEAADLKAIYEEVGASTRDPVASLLNSGSGVSMHIINPNAAIYRRLTKGKKRA